MAIFNKTTLNRLEKHYKKYNDNNYLTFEDFIEECKEVRKAILKDKILIIHQGGMKYQVYIYGKDRPIGIYSIVKRLIGYRYNKNDGTVTITCYGTSRPLEIILNLGYALGLSFDKISQKQIIL